MRLPVLAKTALRITSEHQYRRRGIDMDISFNFYASTSPANYVLLASEPLVLVPHIHQGFAFR